MSPRDSAPRSSGFHGTFFQKPHFAATFDGLVQVGRASPFQLRAADPGPVVETSTPVPGPVVETPTPVGSAFGNWIVSGRCCPGHTFPAPLLTSRLGRIALALSLKRLIRHAFDSNAFCGKLPGNPVSTFQRGPRATYCPPSRSQGGLPIGERKHSCCVVAKTSGRNRSIIEDGAGAWTSSVRHGSFQFGASESLST